MREGTIGKIQSPLQADVEQTIRSLLEICDADFVVFSLAKRNVQLVALGLTSEVSCARAGPADAEFAWTRPDWTSRTSQLVLSDARSVPEFRDQPSVADGTICGYLGSAIENSEVGPIGTISVITSNPREWAEADVQYLNATVLAVETLILRELYRLESVDAVSLVSEYDKIIAAFTLVRAAPTSIHDQSGRLVFANRDLSDSVEIFELDKVFDMAKFAAPVDGSPLRVFSRRSGATYEVRRTTTSSGYFVCQWSVDAGRLN